MTNQRNPVLCRASGSPLIRVMDFGKQPLGNGFLSPEDFADEYYFPMQMGFSEESTLLQLIKQPDPDRMFHENYAYYASTSTFMQMHFRDFADDVLGSGYVSEDPFVIELGCNDGILLRNFASRNIRHLGIEPSQNVAMAANEVGVRTMGAFFDEEVAQTILEEEGPADLFLAANVMCHISDIRSVVSGIRILLSPSGIVQFEDPYLGDVIDKISYDQIYDEHVFLFSAHSVRYLFAQEGMELIDVKPQTTHGGSMRYVLALRGAHIISPSVEKLLESEREQGLDRMETFHAFWKKVEESKHALVDLITSINESGAKVAGYGATSKSTTILNYCGIGPDLIEYISDTTPIKQGKYTPGMHVPVVAYEHFENNRPDYSILFAWNHAEEIMRKETEFVRKGGQWIVHVPEVKVM